MFAKKTNEEMPSSEEMEKVYSLFESIYKDKTLMDYQRREKIFDVCIKNWQTQLPENDRKRRLEIEKNAKDIPDIGEKYLTNSKK